MAKLSLRSALAVALVAPFTPGCTIVGVFAAVEPSYDAGDLARSKTARDAVTRVGCLDVGARASPGEGFVLLDLELANRCNRATPTDLRRLAFVARAENGEPRAIAVYDPDLAITALPLAPRRVGQETLRLDTSVDAASLCVDVAAVTPRAEGDGAEALCFVREGARWRAGEARK